MRFRLILARCGSTAFGCGPLPGRRVAIGDADEQPADFAGADLLPGRGVIAARRPGLDAHFDPVACLACRRRVDPLGTLLPRHHRFLRLERPGAVGLVLFRDQFHDIDGLFRMRQQPPGNPPALGFDGAAGFGVVQHQSHGAAADLADRGQQEVADRQPAFQDDRFRFRTGAVIGHIGAAHAQSQRVVRVLPDHGPDQTVAHERRFEVVLARPIPDQVVPREEGGPVDLIIDEAAVVVRLPKSLRSR